MWNSNQLIETFVGFGVKDAVVETSVDGENWTPLENVPEFARGPGLPSYSHNTTIDMGGVMAKYVKITVQTTWGGLPQASLSEVRILSIPTLARYLQPADAGKVPSIDTTLQWRPGREADQHEVVLSSDLAAVEDNSAVIDTIQVPSISPAPLNYSTTYFWRINEINEVGTPPRYEGDIWSFLAPEYFVIDDFEMYADEEFLEIWAFWADGYQDDEPVWVRVERTGDEFNAFWSLDGVTWNPSANNPQTILMLPDVLIGLCVTSHNVNVPTTAVYSNVTTSGGVSGSWTAEAIGGSHPSNDAAPVYLTVTDASGGNKRISHPNANASLISAWETWAIPMDSLSPVNLSRIQKVTIGLGDPAGASTGAQGTFYVDLLQIGTPLPIVTEPNDPNMP